MTLADRREVILRAATREFATAGFKGASMRGIAGRAGVTTPVLYDHFASKRALYIALVDHHARALHAHQQQDRDAAVGPELARALFTDFFAWVAANPDAWRLLSMEVPAESEIRAAIEQARRLATMQIASFVAMAPSTTARPGIGRAAFDEIVAEAVYGSLERLTAWWQHHQEVPSPALAALAAELIWDGLGHALGMDPVA
jgi:AcrR family transcriptional regulator